MAEAVPEPLEPVDVVTSIEDLEYLAEVLSAAPRFAVDLESDSFYAYHHKICLVQISDDHEDYVIDPLAVRDMSPLGALLRDPRIEKVFHAAEYDIQCLKRDYGFSVRGLFDTMASARLLGARELGLASLILKYFDVHLSKKLQRADWGKRPLTPAQLDYARLDTHYLLELRDLLRAELEERGLLADAKEAFERLEEMEPGEKPFDPDDFWRLPGARLLSPQSRAVLKEVNLFRERTAAEMDKAPFRVLPEPLLVRIAHQPPRDLAALERLPGMTPYLFKRFGTSLLEIVRRGLEAPPIHAPPERPQAERWDTPTMLRFQSLKAWRKGKAEERGVDSVVILATEDLRDLAKAPGCLEEAQWLSALSDRKRELYGEELLKILGAPLPAGGGRRRRRRRPNPTAPSPGEK